MTAVADLDLPLLDPDTPLRGAEFHRAVEQVADGDGHRRPGARVLTFGAGVHFCLGANLARTELEEALALLAPRTPGLRLDGDPVHGSVQGSYGVQRLPVARDA